MIETVRKCHKCTGGFIDLVLTLYHQVEPFISPSARRPVAGPILSRPGTSPRSPASQLVATGAPISASSAGFVQNAIQTSAAVQTVGHEAWSRGRAGLSVATPHSGSFIPSYGRFLPYPWSPYASGGPLQNNKPKP